MAAIEILRDRQNLLLLFLASLFTIALVGRAQLETTNEARFDPASQAEDGLLLLRLWLEEMGLRTATTAGTSFVLPTDAHLLLVYPGIEPFQAHEIEELSNWVAAGHTLALVGNADPGLRAHFGYGFASLSLSATGGVVRPQQPWLPMGPTTWGEVGMLPGLDLVQMRAAAPVLSAGNTATAALAPWGQGHIWLFSRRYTFANATLQAEADGDRLEQGHLVLALLRTVPDNGLVVFDTYHLNGPQPGSSSAPIGSIQDWVYRTPSGWATLFLALLGGLYLLLQGRRLGPALVRPQQGRRREAAEFVVAMAGLQRRAGLPDGVARQQRHRFKEAVGRRGRVAADLADDAFLASLEAGLPNLDPATMDEIRQILDQFHHCDDETALVQTVVRADWLLDQLAQSWVPRRSS